MSSANDNASSPLPGDGVSKRKQGKSHMTRDFALNLPLKYIYKGF